MLGTSSPKRFFLSPKLSLLILDLGKPVEIREIRWARAMDSLQGWR
jgi:hypothetical protein